MCANLHIQASVFCLMCAFLYIQASVFYLMCAYFDLCGISVQPSDKAAFLTDVITTVTINKCELDSAYTMYLRL